MLNQEVSSRKEEASQQVDLEWGQAGGIPSFLRVAERKYDQIMSCKRNDLVHGHSDSTTATAAAAVVGRNQSAVKRKSSDEHHRITFSSSKRFKCNSTARFIVASPGSNSSEVTTEQEIMAESSSRSSACFVDDACTYPADIPNPDMSHDHLRAFSQSLDLNGSPAAALLGRAARGQEMRLLLDETDVEHEQQLNRRAAVAVKAGKSIDYHSFQHQDSWLELGLGPSRHSPNVLDAQDFGNKPHQTTTTEEYFPVAGAQAEEDQYHEVDVSRQLKAPLLHLFPSSESVQVSDHDQYNVHAGSELLPMRRMPATSHQHFKTCAAYGQVPRVRFDQREEPSGFFRSVDPDTQLVISYNNNNNNNVNTYGSIDDQTTRSSSRYGMFGELYQPSSFHQSSETGYASHAYESLSGFQSEDKRSKRASQPQDQLLGAYPWRNETPSSSSAVQVSFPSGVPGSTSRLNIPPSQPSEDWQSLIKRLGGGNLQFQSLFPNVAKPPAASSSDGLIGSDDMQRRRHLHDFQWSNLSQGESTGRGGGSSWSRQLFGGQQDVKPVPYQYSSFQEGSFMSSRPSLWQTSAGLLPFLPPGVSQQQQQLDQYHHQGLFKEQRRSKPTARLSRADPHHHHHEQEHHDIWFYLRAGGANQDSERLPQIPKAYLRVKDGNVPVSHVKKYLVHKLGLSCESEVELSCRGHILLSSLSLQHVRDVIWYSSERTQETSAGKNIVMELSYSKRPLQFTH